MWNSGWYIRNWKPKRHSFLKRNDQEIDEAAASKRNRGKNVTDNKLLRYISYRRNNWRLIYLISTVSLVELSTHYIFYNFSRVVECLYENRSITFRHITLHRCKNERQRTWRPLGQVSRASQSDTPSEGLQTLHPFTALDDAPAPQDRRALPVLSAVRAVWNPVLGILSLELEAETEKWRYSITTRHTTYPHIVPHTEPWSDTVVHITRCPR